MKRCNSLILFVAAAVVVTALFSAVSALADDDHDGPQTTAKEAAMNKNDAEIMKDFVRHAKAHFVIASSDGIAEFFRNARNDEAWNYDSVYLIMLTNREGNKGQVINHGVYTTSRYADFLDGLEPVGKLLDDVKDESNEQPVCAEYEYDGIMRQACAIEFDSVVQPGIKNVLIGGFHHDENDERIELLKCPEYEPAVTAAEVNERQTEESLKDYIEGVIIRFTDAIELLNTGEPAKVKEGGDVIFCFSKPGPWKSGSIYPFVMADDTRVILNGLDPSLAGIGFEDFFDEDGVDIGKEILDTAGEDGAGDFIRYKWDDPSVDGDEVREPGMSPGTSPKITYVRGKNFPRGLQQRPEVYIFGSGIYPKDDDDGCAIAGTDSKPASTAFNLFLVVLSMFFAIFLRKRALGKS
ncbi:MAG: cache domain-containing protein [Candidatus Dadabacteria bacterium]|nr:cache domain-containing protein [Candidatus Dadabacteria bacterium]MDE0476540.1 cache domain-containing protein [Candidatus Dadabacteria bacterium]